MTDVSNEDEDGKGKDSICLMIFLMNCFALIIISALWQLDEVRTVLDGCCYHSFTLALRWCNDILTTSAGQPGMDDTLVIPRPQHRDSHHTQDVCLLPDDIFIVSSSGHDGKMVTETKR